VSVTPIQGTRSWRTSLRAGKAKDARAKKREELIDRRLEQIGLRPGGEIPASLGALLKQRGSPPAYNFNGGFDDDNFGGFDGHTPMDDNEDEWCSEEELEDDIEDEPKSTGGPSDHAIRSKKEVNNWTKLIDIVTGDTVMQGCSPFCTCRKSTRSIPTVSLSAGVLNRSLPLTVKDMSTWNFKYARRVALFVRVCSISSVKVITRRLPSNLILHSTWMFFFSSTRCI
jgi:hypothetical protein